MSEAVVSAPAGAEKYEVRKLDGELLEPGTFFVLRAADQFSYAALWQYASVLQTAMEAGTPELVEQLRPIEQMVEALAQRWQAMGTKVPD